MTTCSPIRVSTAARPIRWFSILTIATPEPRFVTWLGSFAGAILPGWLRRSRSARSGAPTITVAEPHEIADTHDFSLEMNRIFWNAGVAQLVERDFPKVEVRGFETRLPLSSEA